MERFWLPPYLKHASVLQKTAFCLRLLLSRLLLMRQLLSETAFVADCFKQDCFRWDNFWSKLLWIKTAFLRPTALVRLLLEDCIFKANLSCNADFGGLQGGLEKTSKNVCFSHFWRSVLNPHEDPQLPLAFQRAMIFEGWIDSQF